MGKLKYSLLSLLFLLFPFSVFAFPTVEWTNLNSPRIDPDQNGSYILWDSTLNITCDNSSDTIVYYPDGSETFGTSAQNQYNCGTDFPVSFTGDSGVVYTFAEFSSLDVPDNTDWTDLTTYNLYPNFVSSSINTYTTPTYNPPSSISGLPPLNDNTASVFAAVNLNPTEIYGTFTSLVGVAVSFGLWLIQVAWPFILVMAFILVIWQIANKYRRIGRIRR
jgi:hypothetical protein